MPWGCVGALIVPLALLGLVFGLGALLSVEADEMMDRVSGPMVLALFACFGLGLLYYFYRRFVWNPNGKKARLKALRTGKLR